MSSWFSDWVSHNRKMEEVRARRDGDMLTRSFVWAFVGFAGVVLVAALVCSTYIVTRPVEFSLSCGGRVVGNVQFDGREVRTAGLYDWNGSRVFLEYVNGVPAKSGVKIPDFTQAKINGVELNCAMEGVSPAYFLPLAAGGG